MSSIARFLSHKVFFITGATGFLAKGLVEKILRHAPDVRRIYLLVRPKKQSSGMVLPAEERLEREVFNSSAFARLRDMHGARFRDLMRQKVVAVAGDLTRDRLGIDPDRYARLTSEVDIVINSAASVVFDERLDHALELNSLGPSRVVEFAKACKDAVFLHVSTAYVSGKRTGRIPEEPIPPDRTVAELIGAGQERAYDLDAEIGAIQAFGARVQEESQSLRMQERFRQALKRQGNGRAVTEQRLESQLEDRRGRWIKRRLIAEGMRRAQELGWHDSYTFTKAMGEQLIVKTRGGLPTVIVRPSIIESSLLDPEPGWLDGLKVADPLIAHYGKGRLPDFPADPRIVLDLIPVDVVINAILAALPRARQEKEVKVYQVATGSQNPLKLGEMVDLMHDYFKEHPMRNKQGEPILVPRWSFPSPQQFRQRYRWKYLIPLNTLLWLMEHWSILPWSAQLKHKVSVLEATMDRVLSLTEIYCPYTNLDCRFETANTSRLYQELGPVDQAMFNFDVTRIRWREYIQDIHIPGLKRHVLKEGEELPGPRREASRKLPAKIATADDYDRSVG